MQHCLQPWRFQVAVTLDWEEGGRVQKMQVGTVEVLGQLAPCSWTHEPLRPLVAQVQDHGGSCSGVTRTARLLQRQGTQHWEEGVKE
jgi:hypothetical protein